MSASPANTKRASERPPLRWRAQWLALGWTMAAVIVWLSLTPSPPELDLDQGDKLGHFIGYGSLMFWFCQVYGSRRARVGYALGFAALGVALEFIQGALGYRSFEVLDMLANATGVGLGWALALPFGARILLRIETLVGPRA